ncbi:hypothetical protein GCWU000246_00281 [Jonquetella anthropi E3_33 E1]|nr:hypothetical protein GCWU000246_00281 [Jonquetella anthropi E3_33 E1]
MNIRFFPCFQPAQAAGRFIRLAWDKNAVGLDKRPLLCQSIGNERLFRKGFRVNDSFLWLLLFLVRLSYRGTLS